MKRFIIVVLLAACVILGCDGFVYAGTDLGQHCFQLVGGETATLRVSAVQANGSEPMVEIHARWRGIADDGSAYQLLGAGLLTQSHPADAVWSMGLTLVNSPVGVFNPNSMCAFHAKFDAGFNGSWAIDCFGIGAPPLFLTGTMTYVACTNAM